MLRITRMGPTDRREQWGNRNVDRESVNRRLLIAKLLDICLLLFQIRFQTIPLMLTRPNSVHSAIHERFSKFIQIPILSSTRLPDSFLLRYSYFLTSLAMRSSNRLGNFHFVAAYPQRPPPPPPLPKLTGARWQISHGEHARARTALAAAVMRCALQM